MTGSADSRDRARTSFRAAVAAAGLNVVGMALEWVISPAQPAPRWAQALSIAVGLVLLLVLWTRRRTPSVALGSAAFTVNTLAIVLALWKNDEAWAALPERWVPFQPHKLGMLTVALLAPAEPWVGVTSIAAYAVSAIAQLYSFPPAIRERLPNSEPTATVVYAVFATALLVYKLRHLAIVREVARARADARALDRLARVSLAVRDLANSPLQVIAICAALLRRRHPDTAQIAARIERSVARLREGGEVLAALEPRVEWRPGEESFDPKELLETLRREAPR
jgi:hypothetical protein